MKIGVLVGGIALIFIVAFLLLNPQSKKIISNNQSPTATITKGPIIKSAKASFEIFTNSTKRIFADPKYHNQDKDVYMEEANIVIVKKQNITWDDFFKTLPMKLTKECLTTGTGQLFCTNGSQKLRFFINEIEDKDALDKAIKQNDKLLVSYGNKTGEEIDKELKEVPDIN